MFLLHIPISLKFYHRPSKKKLVINSSSSLFFRLKILNFLNFIKHIKIKITCVIIIFTVFVLFFKENVYNFHHPNVSVRFGMHIPVEGHY